MNKKELAIVAFFWTLAVSPLVLDVAAPWWARAFMLFFSPLGVLLYRLIAEPSKRQPKSSNPDHDRWIAEHDAQWKWDCL